MTKKILVVNGASYYKAVKYLGDYSGDVNRFLRSPENFSLVLFTGGEDISPELYGNVSPRLCYHNIDRDRYEQVIFDQAIKYNIPMTGICRGLQFLNVMAGGKMIHHLDGHTGAMHDMSTYRGETILVNSLHHQMVLPPETSYVIGWSSKQRSKQYFGNNDDLIDAPQKEVEAVIYPTIKAAGVQYHPEMMSEDSTGYKWYEALVKTLLDIKNMDEMVTKYISLGATTCHATMSAG